MAKQSLTDDELSDMMSNMPSNCFLVIEDIDAVFNGRTSNTSISFSGLLNAFDGIASAPGLITFMTTNHKEKLDPALLRPGRIDKCVEFTNADLSKASRMYELFYGKRFCTPHTMGDLGTICMAALQGHFIKYKDDGVLALERFGELWD